MRFVFRRGDEEGYRVYSDQIRSLEQRVLRMQEVKICYESVLDFLYADHQDLLHHHHKQFQMQ